MDAVIIFLFPPALLTFLLLSYPAPVSSVCSQFIALSGVSPLGNITSPGWPSPYPPDALCQYKLQGEAWQGIKITFLHFDLETRYSAGCLNDFLEINTVDIHGQRTFLGRFCGAAVPGPILVLHPTAELVFRSNHAVHSNGFVATYEFVDEAFVTTPRLNATSPCGEVVHGIGGTIVSPGYPRGYAAGLDCLWLIRVKYKHAIYVRVQHLEFQGSTANCQKAQLRIYDGYEHSLEDHTVLKKFCGDTRFYKGDDEKVLLSDRNRLLIRFTTTEPSKPVNDSEAMVGFRLVWSDVEFDTEGNCSKGSRFACQEAQICFTQNHKGGASSCPDLRHYCISKELVCDGISHCGENDPSDERNCYRAPIMVTVVAVPLAVLSCGLCICFCWFTRSSKRKEKKRRREIQRNSAAVRDSGHNMTQVKAGEKARESGESCCGDCCCIPASSESERGREQRKEHHHGDKQFGDGGCHGGISGGGKEDQDARSDGESLQGGNGAPTTRGPFYFKNELESPGASDIVSPASGFSDTESELGRELPIYCPAHGPIPLVPVRYLNRHFPLLPAVQEQTYQSDTYDEGGSTYSSGQNSDQIILCPSAVALQNSENHHSLLNHHSDKLSNSTGMVNEWRLRRGVQRSDAIYISDDGKSSIASSPGRICPRCLEKERESQMVGQSRPSSDSKSPSNPLNNLDGSHSQGFVDSGIIDVVDCSILAIDTCGNGVNSGVSGGGPVKNVSFETCTSSDSAISTKGGCRTVSWNTKNQGGNYPQHQTHHHHQYQYPHHPRFKQNNNNVIEEVTSQSQTNSSVASTPQQLPPPPPQMLQGTNQGVQTDSIPSPPPSMISQDDNNLEMEEDHLSVQYGGGSQQRGNSAFCVTVTTFGVAPSGVGPTYGGTPGGGCTGGGGSGTGAKATDV